MENNNILYVDNELHVFCLHYVFLKHSLCMFVNAWNNHPLSTEHNCTSYGSVDLLVQTESTEITEVANNFFFSLGKRSKPWD